MHSTSTNTWVLIATVALAGCSSASPADEPRVTGALRRTQSCDELASALKADAQAKLDARTKALEGFLADPSTRPVFASAGATDGGAGGSSTTPGATGAGGGVATGAGGGSNGGAPAGGSKGGPPPTHSTTTTQVAGVDEADIVKTDGTYLYVLHGNSLAIVDAWPLASLSLSSSTPIEGAPLEMFVLPGAAIVFSTVDPIPILSAASLTPKPVVADAYVAGSAFVPPHAGGPGSSSPMTKITVFSLDGASAVLVAEHWFEGTYVSSRRVGTSVRAVIDGLAHGPVIDPNPPATREQVSALRLAGKSAIDHATAADFLPLAARRSGGAIEVAPPSCGDFFVPAEGSAEIGVLRVVELDVTHPTETTGVTITGRADKVYGDADTLWIAARPYRDRDVIVASALAPGAPAKPITLDQTILHAFDFSKPGAPKYVASGRIDGRVPDQFAMDEKAGALRVATTGQRVVGAKELTPGGTPNAITPEALSHLVVVAANGAKLDVVGDAGDVAPGDPVQATRFHNDRAYLLTSRSASPLVAIDVTNARAPSVVGSLDIPGFAEFVQPIDDGHLLTIGRDPSAGGTALALSIFDVADASAPKLVQHFPYAGIAGYSSAETDQKAFTYWHDRGLLAFPYVGVQAAGGLGGLKSTLEVFRVAPDTGFTKLGSIDHGQLFATSAGFCNGNYGVDVRRGAFIEDVVYSISYGGVIAAAVSDPGTPLGQLALPPPGGPTWICN